MKTAFIIHGAYGSPEENWFPWLKEELEKEEYKVIIPKFPTPEDQSLDNWLKIFDKYKKEIDSNTIFIGHSLGPAFILAILENINIKIKSCFFVSGFISLLGNPQFDNLNNTFVNKEFNWDKIKTNCKSFYIFHSDNDPYVPIEKAEELATKLGVKTNIIQGAGHFNEKAGYIKFEELLKLIKNIQNED